MSDLSSTEQRTETPLPDLAALITAGAVRLAAATATWLRLIAEFDRRDGWHGAGIMSCAHWLAWQCGLSPGAAREHVRVARALESLPLIEAAFAEGRLSYSKVRALTRIAEPDTEVSLLDLALETTASQVERTVRQWRRADRLNSGAEPVSRKPSFEHWWDDDGMLVAKVRLPPEEGATFIASIESLAERSARRERAQQKKATVEGPVDTEEDGHPVDEARRAAERLSAGRVHALTLLARVAADADRRAGDPPRREVVVHVDAAVLADDAAAGRAYLEGGPALSGADIRRMLCEATVVTMLEQGREPLAVGRRKRRATKGQRRALLRRDGGCARPGCTETRIERLHAHHLRHWLFGGHTDLPNMVLLCDRDHGLVHDLDLVMTRRDGALIVTTPDGRRVWGAADAAFAGGLDGLADLEAPVDGPWDDAFVGVHPIDTVVGRRPADARRNRAGIRPGTAPAGRSNHGTRPPGRRTGRRAAIGATLFPGGEPPLPDALKANGERMDMRYVIGVLMGNRDLIRRLAAEQRVPAGT
jgi:hypothetical protein